MEQHLEILRKTLQNGGRNQAEEWRNQEGKVLILSRGAWTLWNHSNKCVFEGASPSLSAAQNFSREARLLCMAAASKLQELLGYVVGLGHGGGLL